MGVKKTIRVLVIDDSAMVRQILTKGLSQDREIEVVDTASNPYIARDKIIQHNPDVLTLDVEMPRMDGIDFLRRLMPQHPLPVVMVSSLTEKGKKTTIAALEAGAIDFVTKPSSNVADGLSKMISELAKKVKIASKASVSHYKNKKIPKKIPSDTKALDKTTHKVIAIGASTGGTEAIRAIINTLPSTCPGVVICQHMPPGFTKLYAESLNETAAMNVVEGKSGDRVYPGRVVIAPGAKHMRLKRVGGNYEVECSAGPKVNGHCPSCEVLFKSVAEHAGANACGVILTGMGRDGAEGLLDMKKVGAFNIAQNQKTSVIFSMPKVAIEIGAVDEVLALDEIATNLISHMRSQ